MKWKVVKANQFGKPTTYFADESPRKSPNDPHLESSSLPISTYLPL